MTTLAGQEDIASHALKVDMPNFEIESKVTRSCRSLISVAFHMSHSCLVGMGDEAE